MSIGENNLAELKKYAESLRMVAKNKVEAIFPNKDHQHAAIALSTIMDFTEKRFILFDDNLENDIIQHDNICSFKDSFEQLLCRGVQATIIISDPFKQGRDDDGVRKFFENNIEKYPNFSMKLGKKDFKNAMYSIYNEKINFAIGDSDKFRLEMFGHKSVDSKKRAAFVSFNNTKYVDEILEVFDRVCMKSTDYFTEKVGV